MDNYQGDLTDIVRASGGALAQSHDNIGLVSNWEFSSDPLNLSSSSSSAMDDSNVFGDPFCNLRDPLLRELNVAGSCYFGSPPNSTDHLLSTSVDDTTSFPGANCTNNDTSNNHLLAHHKVFEDDQMNKSPCDIFSRIQISQNNPTKLPVSPCDSPVIAAAASSPQGFKASSVVSIDMINPNSSKACLIDNTPPLQISSPRNLGIKRRKSQAKKVVCIPAPAAANSRPGGEVVPSDLWAWRKYGQKPIKGSPYPRGYYRCSSSKGCSARKQVERSRTDPNMLVITYTSEHNHPWPTQRNALAGSTRSQPLKNNAASKSSSSSQPQNKASNTKEEQKESSNDTHEQLLSPPIAAASSTASAPVKEEIEDIEKQMEMDDVENQFSTEGYPYRPTMPDSNHNRSEDFFADLGEIEADPLDLLFSRGFSSHHDQKESKILDPFSLFDWSGDNNSIINNSNSFGEGGGKGGL